MNIEATVVFSVSLVVLIVFCLCYFVTLPSVNTMYRNGTNYYLTL